MNRFKTLKKALEPTLKETREYKRLNLRKFNPSRNYFNYKDIVLQISAHMLSVEESLRFGKLTDPTYVGCTHAFFQAMRDNCFGVYGVDKELMLDFLDTDAPEEIVGLPRPFKRALILFPKDFIKTPDNLDLNWALVEFLDPETYLQEVKETFDYIVEKTEAEGVTGQCKNVIDVPLFRWTSVVSFECLYMDTFVVPYPRESYSYVPYISIDGFNKELEKSFLSKVSNILFLLILFLTSSNEKELNNIESPEIIPKRKKREDPKQLKDYVIIGKDYKPRRKHQGGSHASPRGHVRRGHVRTLPWRDEGKQQVWVSPCWVGGE